MNQSHVLKRRKPVSATFFGAAAIAMAVGAIATPALAHAQFNKQSFDKCAEAADKRFVNGTTNQQTWQDEYRFCCDRAGGVWNRTTHECTEQAGSFQPGATSLPDQVATGPGQGTLPGTRRD